MNDINFDKKLYEETINDILPGLTMYVRDVDLDEKYASKYKVGMIIKERGFTDASDRVMGMDTTHRYAILSNHMADLKEYEEGTNWGLHVAKNGAHFKVLDIYEYESKTQILLLHLPDDLRWTLFKNVDINIDKDIITDSRTRFENKCLEEPVKELTTKEWKLRCEFPIGVSDSGDMFELDETIESLLKPINKESFRKLEHKLLYIQGTDIIKDNKDILDMKDMTGVVAYGYIDEEAGMSFHVYGSARIENGTSLIVEKIKEKHMFILRRGSISECTYVDLADVVIGVPDCSELIAMVNDGYKPKSEDKEILRTMDFLDSSRHEDYPDDVAVILPPIENKRPERVWVRADRITDEMLYGKMLNEPDQDFRVHMGDEIGFAPMTNDNDIILVAMLK